MNIGEQFAETQIRYRLQYRVGADETWIDYRRSADPRVEPFDFDRWGAAHQEGQLGMWRKEYSEVRIITRWFTVVYTLIKETIAPIEEKQPVWYTDH